jgi:Lon protease-like protein
MPDWNGHDPCPAVPLFPLPNIVLFPRAVLPLHIFEHRYRSMTADALTDRRLIAMALLKPGWERDYYSKPQIEPIVCVGQILTHEQLPDGKYNLLLQGIGRAKISQEVDDPDRLYRAANLDPLIESPVLEIDLTHQRQKLSTLFETRLHTLGGLSRQFRQMLTSPMPTADIADLAAFNLLDNIPLKQSLLADPDIVQRVNRLITALDQIQPPKPSLTTPIAAQNPNMN